MKNLAKRGQKKKFAPAMEDFEHLLEIKPQVLDFEDTGSTEVRTTIAIRLWPSSDADDVDAGTVVAYLEVTFGQGDSALTVRMDALNGMVFTVPGKNVLVACRNFGERPIYVVATSAEGLKPESPVTFTQFFETGADSATVDIPPMCVTNTVERLELAAIDFYYLDGNATLMTRRHAPVGNYSQVIDVPVPNGARQIRVANFAGAGTINCALISRLAF